MSMVMVNGDRPHHTAAVAIPGTRNGSNSEGSPRQNSFRPILQPNLPARDATRGPATDGLKEGSTAMLVLSRQRDESIFIGDNIKITVVDIRGDKVRLGIEAPTEIPVHRQEVYEAIQRENQQRIGTNGARP
jgi:carbon storage regulator